MQIFKIDNINTVNYIIKNKDLKNKKRKIELNEHEWRMVKNSTECRVKTNYILWIDKKSFLENCK